MTDNESIQCVEIRGGGLTAQVITFGAALQALYLDGIDHPLVLGFRELHHYPVHSPYFGATAGRYANRIAHGRFAIDGEVFEVNKNFLDKHLLHGGVRGIGKRNWVIKSVQDDGVTLGIRDPDMHMGFPGNCDITCGYRLLDTGILSVNYQATTDKPTLCNLAHHSYFNLDGSENILDHQLQIHAAHYLPVDDELIPTGEVKSVEQTHFDFVNKRVIRCIDQGSQVLYDHNFCVAEQRGALKTVATLQGPNSGLEMTLSTTEPGVQFYAGRGIATDVPGLTGNCYGPHAGLCLEPQIWPDAPNHPAFPCAMLYPGQTYSQETIYQFTHTN